MTGPELGATATCDESGIRACPLVRLCLTSLTKEVASEPRVPDGEEDDDERLDVIARLTEKGLRRELLAQNCRHSQKHGGPIPPRHAAMAVMGPPGLERWQARSGVFVLQDRRRRGGWRIGARPDAGARCASSCDLPPKFATRIVRVRPRVRGLRFLVHSEGEPAAVWSILSANSRGLRPLRDR